MKYENRITVFLDILGFKNIIDSTIDTQKNDIEVQINLISETFGEIRKLLDVDNPKEFSQSRQVTLFSDSIVISFKEDEISEVFYTLLEVQHVIINLVLKGIICRGAISFGKLIHTEKMIFGPALNEAYITESKATLYPRIILSKSIIEKAAQSHASHNTPKDEIESISQIIKKDTDDMFYIDYFSKAQSELDDPENDMPEYIENLKNIIIDGLKKGKEKPDVYMKYSWMKNKFNKMVMNCNRNSKTIVDQELKDYYQNLKKID
jgi:hypothetical protein